VKINTSSIDKNPFMSEYTRKFGKGTEGKNNMAFALLKCILFGSFAFIGVAALAHVACLIFLGTGFWNEFWSIDSVKAFATALYSAIMLILGYLFKGVSE
jgi:hypothetical protein